MKNNNIREQLKVYTDTYKAKNQHPTKATTPPQRVGWFVYRGKPTYIYYDRQGFWMHPIGDVSRRAAFDYLVSILEAYKHSFHWEDTNG